MKGKYPGDMSFTQWRRTPFRVRHRLVGLALNDHFRYWRTCDNAQCRRARACQDYECYWRRLNALPHEEQKRVRADAAPFVTILWIGCRKGSEGRWLY